MAKRERVWNRSVYDRYLREGRGCGSGSGYAPWIWIQNFASNGIVSRVKGRKTERIHHLMSKNELAYFYLLDWSDDVLDIREQYPLLDLETAQKAASQAGIKYPTDNISGFPYVLTCDFMITTLKGLKARTIKLSSELNDKRVLEKLEIERRYWLIYGIDWKIATEKEISYVIAKNIEWVYSVQGFDIENIYKAESDAMFAMFDNSHCSAAEIVRKIEAEYSLSEGVGLALFKYLLFKKYINVDLGKPLSLNGIKKVSVLR